LATAGGDQVVHFEIIRPVELDREAQIIADLLSPGRYQLARVGDTSRGNRRTIIYYQPGYSRIALELAHRIPGNQTVQSGPPEDRIEIKIVLGSNILSQIVRLRPRL
jgi:hypothetical protein